jgi:PAS domain S-box-containing protein
MRSSPDAVNEELLRKLREGDPYAGNEIFRLLVEGVKEYAIFLLDPGGFIVTWNEGAQDIKGYRSDEIVGQHFSKFYLPEAIQSGWPTRELELAKQDGRFADEGWRVKKDGSSFWASVTITAVRDKEGRLIGFSKVTRDLTDRKKIEENIQELNGQLRQRVSELAESQRIVELRTLELQRLSGQLLRAQDVERQRLARELHDELGQQLSALSMVLGKADKVDQGSGKNAEALQLADEALKTVRNLSYLLHPPLLEEVGLAGALHWYVEGLTKRNGIEVSLVLKPTSFPRLHKDVEITVFRIVQEALTNVYRHAETKSARVEIDRQQDTVKVRVRDYGKGLPGSILDGGRGASRFFGVGLSGMRERVRQFGGEVLLSREEPGTLVEARIPLFGHLPE